MGKRLSIAEQYQKENGDLRRGIEKINAQLAAKDAEIKGLKEEHKKNHNDWIEALFNQSVKYDARIAELVEDNDRMHEREDIESHRRTLRYTGPHRPILYSDTVMLRTNCMTQSASSTGRGSMDKGPWTERCDEETREVYVESADFDRNVMLTVNGDFRSRAEKMKYAEWLADKLNGTTSS